MDIKQKKALYESIMKSVAIELKKALNEDQISECDKYPAIEKYGLNTIFESCNEDGNSEDSYIQKLKDPVEKALEKIAKRFPEKAKELAENIKNAAKSGKHYLRVMLFAIILIANNLNALAEVKKPADLHSLNVPQTENAEVKTAGEAAAGVWYGGVFLPQALIDANDKADELAAKYNTGGHHVVQVHTNYDEFPNDLKTKEDVLEFAYDMFKDNGAVKSSMRIIQSIKYEINGQTEYIFIVAIN